MVDQQEGNWSQHERREKNNKISIRQKNLNKNLRSEIFLRETVAERDNMKQN
jgi:hypothetical protein